MDDMTSWKPPLTPPTRPGTPIALPVEKKKKQEKQRSFWVELPILIVVAFGIALLVKTFLVQAFWIPSESMEDTLKINDRVLVSKMSYRFGDPRQGDVVVFIAPPGEDIPEPASSASRALFNRLGLGSKDKDLIKRVIATGGQTIQIKGGRTYVDERQVAEPYRKDQTPLPDYGPYKVPPDALFVMGDNRFQSHDARAFGAIKESSVVGRAFVRIWPLGRLGSLG